MRLIDADALVPTTLTDGAYWTKEVYYKSDIDAAPTIYPTPNDPLTLEELLEMEGEPVWIEPIGNRYQKAEWGKLLKGIKVTATYEYETADGTEKIIDGTGNMVAVD